MNWIWKECLHRNGRRYLCIEWDMVVDDLLVWSKGSSLQSRLGKLTLAVVVYCVWQERNQRIFTRQFRTEEAVLLDIESYLRAKTYKWSVDRCFTNWYICKSWGLDEKLMM